MCEKLEERVGQGEFNISPYITLCALDIICETAMGKHLNTQTDNSSQYLKVLHQVCEMIVKRFKSPWMWPNLLFYLFGDGRKFDKYLKIVQGFTKNVIETRQKEYNENEAKMMEDEVGDADESNVYIKKKRRAFLDLLLYHWHRGELTTEEIQEEVDTFMFAGHDTVSVGMTWAIYMIVSHPEVYRKVNQEIDDVFGDSNRPAMLEDLKKLDYMEMALKETLRLYPSVSIIGRKTTEELDIDGYKIPAKYRVTLFIGGLHKDPQYFPEPLVYNPDRFLPENIKERHPYAFIPFSAGRRNCIGQKFAMVEEKILLTWIFRKFRVETTQVEADIHPEMNLVLRPKYGVKVKLSKR
ncbi:CYP4V2 [Acanthosepion pharaonis]|uniref:CYP4V2 n=1 Tax=Acanthosepion pharaonis TaxID=158019 RepID=A0A812ES30_ACAPH|nr:CYP4V2 [Sepia pharaonis]